MRIINSELNITNYSDLKEIVINAISNSSKITLYYMNVFVSVYAKNDKSFNRILNEFDYSYIDGIGVFLAAKSLYNRKYKRRIEKMTGTDFYVDLFRISGEKGYKIFLISKNENLNISQLKEKFSDVNIVGFLNLKQLTENAFECINDKNPDLLLIGTGTPSQEKWIIQNKKNLNSRVIMSVGSGIDFLSGNLKRAPLWMRKIGLEWLFRLFQEPKRLWKRYIMGIPLFIFYVLRQKVKLVLNKTEE